jgi:hypothetical protein
MMVRAQLVELLAEAVPAPRAMARGAGSGSEIGEPRVTPLHARFDRFTATMASPADLRHRSKGIGA